MNESLVIVQKGDASESYVVNRSGFIGSFDADTEWTARFVFMDSSRQRRESGFESDISVYSQSTLSGDMLGEVCVRRRKRRKRKRCEITGLFAL